MAENLDNFRGRYSTVKYQFRVCVTTECVCQNLVMGSSGKMGERTVSNLGSLVCVCVCVCKCVCVFVHKYVCACVYVCTCVM